MAREVWFRLFVPIGLAGSVPRKNERSFCQLVAQDNEKGGERAQKGSEFSNNSAHLDYLEA